MYPQPRGGRVIGPEREHCLDHCHSAETQNREHDPRAFERSGRGRFGKHTDSQLDSEGLERKIADRCRHREHHRPPRQGAGCRIGQALREQISDAEDQDGAQCDRLRRLVSEPEARHQAETHAHQPIDRERQYKCSPDRASFGNRYGTRPALRGNRLDRAARSKERMRFVKRVRDDVKQRQREQREPAFEDHEAHLRHCRPRQRGLDRRLGQHDQTPNSAVKPPALITPAWSSADTGVGLDYADTVFRAGDELLSTLDGSPGAIGHVLRVGALTTLSRNFQLEFLRPLIGRADVELIVRSGTTRDLLAQLEAHALDVVLSNRAAQRDARMPFRNLLLDQQPVSLVGRPRPGHPAFRFPDDLRSEPILLPSLDSDIRVGFDRLLDLAGIRPIIVAEVDDMAMLRPLAHERDGVTLVPPIVVRDELLNGVLVEHCRIPQLGESFYAIMRNRRFPNMLLGELLDRYAVIEPEPAAH